MIQEDIKEKYQNTKQYEKFQAYFRGNFLKFRKLKHFNIMKFFELKIFFPEKLKGILDDQIPFLQPDKVHFQ